MNKDIGIPENLSESLSFISLSFFEGKRKRKGRILYNISIFIHKACAQKWEKRFVYFLMTFQILHIIILFYSVKIVINIQNTYSVRCVW